MDPNIISNVLAFVGMNRYILVFFIMVLEGPSIAFLAGFSASLGYFKLWILLLLAIFGNLLPDLGLYGIGKLLRGPSMRKLFGFVGLSKRRISWLEENINKHTIKTISLVKLIPPLPLPGLIMAGFLNVNFKKFFLVSLVFDLFAGAFFVLLGYYSGITLSALTHYLKLGNYVLLIALFITVLIYFLVKFLSVKFAKEVEN